MIYFVSPGNGMHCSLYTFLCFCSHHMLGFFQSNIHLQCQVFYCYDRVPSVGFDLFHNPASFLRRTLDVSVLVDSYII